MFRLKAPNIHIYSESEAAKVRKAARAAAVDIVIVKADPQRMNIL